MAADGAKHGVKRGEEVGARGATGAATSAGEEAEFEAMTFEQLVEALEALTSQMAAGDIGIEEVADLYERAGRLHALATERLEGVRRRIERLVAEDVAGDEAGPTSASPTL